jgi:hypothetical protein
MARNVGYMRYDDMKDDEWWNEDDMKDDEGWDDNDR